MERRIGAPSIRSALSPLMILALSMLLVPTGARASCEESELAAHVRVRRCAEADRAWVELIADLEASDVGVQVARPGERGRAAGAWLAGVAGGLAAVPGGELGFPSLAPEGLTIGEGEAWPEGEDDTTRAVLALDASNAGFVAAPELLVPADPWMHSAISGLAVVRRGVVALGCEGRGCARQPRTAVGLDEGAHHLVIVVARGWTADVPGVTTSELGALALAAGAHDAILTGSGASSELALREGEGVPSSDGAPRAGGAWLALRNRDAGPEGNLVGTVWRREDNMPLTSATITVRTPDGRMVASGGTMTTSAYYRFALAERTYLVTAHVSGYADECRVCTVVPGMDVWCSFWLEPGSGGASCEAPPRGIDAGAYPVGDAGTGDAGAMRPDAGPATLGATCAVSPRAMGAPWLSSMALALLLLLRRRAADQSHV